MTYNIMLMLKINVFNRPTGNNDYFIVDVAIFIYNLCAWLDKDK